jgi:hypothetical protein
MPTLFSRSICFAIGTFFLASATIFAQAQQTPQTPQASEAPPFMPSIAELPQTATVDNGEPCQICPQVPDRPPETPANPWSYADSLWHLLEETPPRGFGFMQGAGFGIGQSPVPSASYRVVWLPTASVSGQPTPTDLSAVRQDLRLTYPVWHDDCQMFGLTAGVRNVTNDTTAMLPNGQQIPAELWDVRFGFTYKYLFSNGWTTGTSVEFGSASNLPFHSWDEMTVGLSTFLRIPVGEHNAWLFSLTYSPTGEVDFPLPGVAFYWQPSDSFNATIGVPFKVVWRPVEDVVLEASYMPLTNVKAKAAWHLWGGVSLYVGYDLGNEEYFLADRPDVRERFFYYDQRVSGGMRLQFGPHCALDLSGGYAFDRFYFEGDSYSDRNTNRIDIGDTPFLALSLEMRF